MSNTKLRLYYFIGLLAGAIALTACTAGTLIPAATPVAATTPRAISDEQLELQIPTETVRPTLPLTATALPTSTPAPTSSPTPTAIASSTPSPTVTTIACVDGVSELEKHFPGVADLQMQNSHTFFDGDFVYLATQNYLGLVDTTIPAQPKFYGFWQLPQPEQATDVLAHNGLLYVSSGSVVQVLNLNPACRLSPVAQLDLPFNATRMEVEDGRLYVGGINDQLNTEQLAIFAIQSPGKLEQLGLLDLGEEPARWSVQQKEVFLLSGAELSVIDVSDPTTPAHRSVNITLDVEHLVRQPREMVGNAFYYFSFSEGLNVVRQLDQTAPNVQVTPKEYALSSVTRAVTNLMQIDQDYIFLGINWCDGGCASVINIISRENFEPLAVTGLQPHYPVHNYVEITKELVYAFSNDQLLVIDLSDLEEPSIIWKVPLTI